MGLKETIARWWIEGVMDALKTGEPNLRSRVAKFLIKGRITKMLDSLREKLDGYKTYIAGIGAIVAAFVAWSQGTMGTDVLIQTLVTAILGMTLKSAIKKAEVEK